MEETAAVLTTVEEIAEGLVSLGYEAQVDGQQIVTKIKSFPILLQVGQDDLSVTCEVAVWGQVPEDKILATALAALDANTLSAISPFAFGTITSSDDPESDDEEKWPLVLTDTVPLGDFSLQELGYLMDQLLGALIASRDVLSIAFE